MDLAPAKHLAEKIVVQLTTFCDRIEIAGSIRRGRLTVNDIDIVCLPKSGVMLSALLERCGRSAKKLKAGDQYCVFELANGFQLDLWIAHPSGVTPDLFDPKEIPGNFGSLLFARTGSAMHNVYFAQVCQAKGLHFNPHVGVLQRGKVIAGESETDLFRVTGLPWIPPERRER
jgi:DNA polymerase (family 10)